MNVIERDSANGELMLTPHDVMTVDTAPVVLMRSGRRGSVVVRYTRIERWDVVDDGQPPLWRRPAQFALVAAGGIAIGAAMALAFSGQSTAPVRARDASVALSPIAAAPVAPVRAMSAPVALPARSRALPVKTATVAATIAPAPAVAIERPGPDSEAAALAQAFSTDEAVSWRSTTGTGTVVVGAAAIENGKYCRDVAILTRAEGVADRSINARKCLEPGGRITDQPAPPPQ